tara:strand:+ start:535 stop:909 length:375 start_codon:yes stop_codon:yes gene_type:complete
MAHYALLNINNKVTNVFVGRDQEESNINWEIYYTNQTNQACKTTSVNTLAGKHKLGGTPFRKNFAAIGFIYDQTRNAFIEKQPHSSWVLNEESCIWEPPVKYPDDGNLYGWNQETQQWDLIGPL